MLENWIYEKWYLLCGILSNFSKKKITLLTFQVFGMDLQQAGASHQAI